MPDAGLAPSSPRVPLAHHALFRLRSNGTLARSCGWLILVAVFASRMGRRSGSRTEPNEGEIKGRNVRLGRLVVFASIIWRFDKVQLGRTMCVSPSTRYVGLFFCTLSRLAMADENDLRAPRCIRCRNDFGGRPKAGARRGAAPVKPARSARASRALRLRGIDGPSPAWLWAWKRAKRDQQHGAALSIKMRRRLSGWLAERYRSSA